MRKSIMSSVYKRFDILHHFDNHIDVDTKKEVRMFKQLSKSWRKSRKKISIKM